MNTINYEVNSPLTPDNFIDILKRANLAKRRPIDNRNIIAEMVKNANLTICATTNQKIIGIVRCVTDFAYCCYLSDLAVDVNYQKQGIGKNLIYHIQKKLKPSCKIILLAAPAAIDYYPKLGFFKHNGAFILQNN